MRTTSTLIAAAVCMLIISCKKSDTMIYKQFKPDVKNCLVLQIIHSPCCGMEDTMVFSYNQWGDPISITQLPSPKTGAPNYIFKYDKKRRLTDVIGVYAGGSGAEFWHKYFYANPGNSDIFVDSVYSFVQLSNGTMISAYYASAIFLSYDKAGRVVKDSMSFNGGQFMTVNNYVYDSNGNLQGRIYDDKVNIHQTSKIWMFLDRDYSINNPVIAESYNSSGLPTAINTMTESSGFFRFLTGLRQATIRYSCD